MFLNLGLTNASWILFTQKKTQFVVMLTAFLLFSVKQIFNWQQMNYCKATFILRITRYDQILPDMNWFTVTYFCK